MRSVTISILSFLLTLIVIANAYYQKKQFYPSVVYITKSNPSMAVSNMHVIKYVPFIYSPLLLGNIYSSFYICMDKWKNYAKNIFWPVKNY